MIRTWGFSKQDIEDHFEGDLHLQDSDSMEFYLEYYDLFRYPAFKQAFLRVFREVQEHEDILRTSEEAAEDPQEIYEISEGNLYNFIRDLSEQIPGSERISYSWLYDFASYMLLFFRDELDVDELYNRPLIDFEQGRDETTFTLR